MAEIVVSALVGVLIEKLVSGDLMNFARSERIDSQLKKWKTTLLKINELLGDASQKHITNRVIQLWLDDLQDLAYDIDDVLDEMATEVMRRKLNQAPDDDTTNNSMVFSIIPTCCTNFTPHNIMYGRKISSKLDEITNKLHHLFEEKINLGLDVNVKVERSKRNEVSEQTSLVDESKILGREGDKEALLGKLLFLDEASNQNFGVVSIVGLGGIGKTTLAKVLYNDEKVKAHFELRVWVCVSGEFDVNNISKTIFQAVNGKNEDFVSLDLLHVAIKEKLLNKRFLIVLDDVWNEDHRRWELLQGPLIVGASGSKVIVTTRKTMVASVMDNFEPHNLEVLSDEIALSLFAQYALGEQNFDKHPESLKLIAKGIIKKCDGLPLALITLGRVLKTKGKYKEWDELLNSEIWNLKDESGILPALKLSYYDLAPHLKQLFAYCSLFPKDYLFDKNELVLLWMAEGFLSHSNDNKSMESLGRQYFEELQSRSFFQPSSVEVSRYTMHNLMHDLAISVAGKFFFMLDDKTDVNGRNEAFQNFRHFSYINSVDGLYRKFMELRRESCLRTILNVSVSWKWPLSFTLHSNVVDFLLQLQFLRVLHLTKYSIGHVPEHIGRLKHLRYLNFSTSCIKELPEEVSDLYNLQSLLVRDCVFLRCLPASFVKLKNLRHLDIDNTPLLRKTPSGIGGLTSLQTLSKVCIEKDDGFKISELKSLVDLQGLLLIQELEKVEDLTQAEDACIHQKTGLDDLGMQWSRVFDRNRNSTTEYEVIERLRPHHKLKKLTILFYGGMKFPKWVGDPSFNQLTELILEGCRKCTHLPTLGHLSSLQKLYVRSMDDVKTLGFELLARATPFLGISFPSLTLLEVSNMRSLEKWSTCGGDNDGVARSFPRLHTITLEECPKLSEVSIGLIPKLQNLYIKRCSEAVLRAMVGVSSSILKLTMVDLLGLTQLHGEVLKNLGAVKTIIVMSCAELKYLWESKSQACKFLTSLRSLDVSNCNKLLSLGEKEVNVGSEMEYVRDVCPDSVEKLFISGCSSMTSLTFSTMQKLPSSERILDTPDERCDNLTTSPETDHDSIESVPHNGIRFLPQFGLRYLEIGECENLKSFPHEHFHRLASLEELKIRDCPNLDHSFPCAIWPPNLRILGIGCLNKPMSEWGLQNYPTSLVNLDLNGKNSGVLSFAMEEDVSSTSSTTFLLPRSLTSLQIRNFKYVESLSKVLQHLTRLQDLTIWSCPNLKNLPETTSSLRVWVH